MDENNSESKKRSRIKDLWRLLLTVVGIVAVVGELQKPADERTWHGKVADLIPYDFRVPTPARFRDTYWNPEGPIVSSKLFGVGWALNLGAVKQRILG